MVREYLIESEERKAKSEEGALRAVAPVRDLVIPV